jgi:Txe/YoeB family toxin of Txe-Axe toxin-antitoxin module
MRKLRLKFTSLIEFVQRVPYFQINDLHKLLYNIYKCNNNNHLKLVQNHFYI